MKKEKLILSLSKETVTNLNNTELNEIKGGFTKRTECIIGCLATKLCIITRYLDKSFCDFC